MSINKILFLDIETVPATEDFSDLSSDFRELWDKKAAYISREEEYSAEELYERAGIYAEFGKIICISVGYMNNSEFRLKSFSGDDEIELLEEFAEMLRHFNAQWRLCAHNGKEFDFPYIARRMLVNRIRLPELLNIAGKKPWEIQHIDTMDLWKFGDYKHFTSLNLLAALFEIPSPKDDIDGSQVRNVYYEDKDLNRIVEYCEKDVITVARVYCRMKGLDDISDTNTMRV